MSLSAGAPALSVSGEEAQHASLLRARSVPRWIWSAYALQKGATPAQGLSLSTHDRGTTCQLRPLMPSQRRMSPLCISHTCALAITREEVQRSSLPYARLGALFSINARIVDGRCADERPLFFSACP